jgi:transcription elongation factor GreA
MASMENDKIVYLTQEGLNRLQAELEVLRSKRRPEVAERIRQAKEFGDINENAEYDDAKNEQGFVEGRVLLLEKLVRNASIIEGKHAKGIVEVGSTVKVHDEYGDEAFTIVGSAEAEPAKGRISLESPVGKALLGKRVGDDVSVVTPGGSTKMLIIEVR